MYSYLLCPIMCMGMQSAVGWLLVDCRCSDVTDLIKATPEADILRRDINDRRPIFSWCKGRVALLGDSAHAMQPNLGQGGCMAIEDAFQLGEDIEAALAKVCCLILCKHVVMQGLALRQTRDLSCNSIDLSVLSHDPAVGVHALACAVLRIMRCCMSVLMWLRCRCFSCFSRLFCVGQQQC